MLCTSTRPSPPRPTRPASWAISANVRSSARKSGKRRVASASSTTPSVTSRKSWPLATIWVPISTPEGAASKRRSTAPTPSSPAPGAGHVGVEAEHREAPVVERGRELVLHALGARAMARHRGGAAVAAARRRGLAVSAVVTGHVALGAVQHERDVAVRAAPHPPAGAAREEVRPAAAVEQHHRLPAVRCAPRQAHGRSAGAGPALSPRMSRIWTSGSGRPSTRPGSRSGRGTARALSGRGVALPSSSSAPQRLARSAATSRAS